MKTNKPVLPVIQISFETQKGYFGAVAWQVKPGRLYLGTTKIEHATCEEAKQAILLELLSPAARRSLSHNAEIEAATSKPSKAGRVTWILPQWAADTLYETLRMDANSSAFDPKLREEIRQAMETINDDKPTRAELGAEPNAAELRKAAEALRTYNRRRRRH